MADNSADCPYCGKLISPKPKRHRKCPHCRQPIRVRRGWLFTEQGEEKYLEELQREAERKERQELAKRMNEFRDIEGYKIEMKAYMTAQEALPVIGLSAP